jgi:hypothetical protein
MAHADAADLDGYGYAGDFDNAQSYAARLARIDAGLPMWPGPDDSLSEKSMRCEQNTGPGCRYRVSPESPARRNRPRT